jgi:hypothetical protein
MHIAWGFFMSGDIVITTKDVKGFVLRKDGGWWISYEDDKQVLHSMSDAEANKLHIFSQTVFMKQVTPRITQNIEYILTAFKYHATRLLYAIAKQLEPH